MYTNELQRKNVSNPWSTRVSPIHKNIHPSLSHVRNSTKKIVIHTNQNQKTVHAISVHQSNLNYIQYWHFVVNLIIFILLMLINDFYSSNQLKKLSYAFYEQYMILIMILFSSSVVFQIFQKLHWRCEECLNFWWSERFSSVNMMTMISISIKVFYLNLKKMYIMKISSNLQ